MATLLQLNEYYNAKALTTTLTANTTYILPFDNINKTFLRALLTAGTIAVYATAQDVTAMQATISGATITDNLSASSWQLWSSGVSSLLDVSGEWEYATALKIVVGTTNLTVQVLQYD